MWNLESYSDHTSLIDDGGTSLTYGELSQEARLFAKAVGARCLIFILCRNTIGSIVGYVGALEGGIVPLLLSASLDRELLNGLIRTYRPAYLWAPSDLATELKEASEADQSQSDLAAGHYCDVYENHGYVLLDTTYGRQVPLFDDLALLLTTSGSTGSPQLVRQSYNNVSNNARAIADYLQLDEKERPVTTLPMNYTYGLSIINSHLMVGATILLTECSIVQAGFWNFMMTEHATSFGGVPYTYELMDRMRLLRRPLPDLRTMTQAGGKLSPELHEKMAKYADENGKRFVVMYGQCEATARMGYLPPDKALTKKGSMGIAIPGGRFMLIDENGAEIHTPHTTGELVYEGQNVTLGYATCAEDLVKGDERHGRLVTGDMAMFDEDGYYYIVGRKKRFLKIYGNRVNLDEVDRMVRDHFHTEAVCTGRDDALTVFVTDDLQPKEVVDFLSERTGLHVKAFHVRHIDAIPKNEAGKVLFRELEALL